ncbi:MAG TPA: hypothetical protein VH054_16805, partial [Polyangiaceae bacterium]|nr:hypothetical protein [Polyangiaceae bacterium]
MKRFFFFASMLGACSGGGAQNDAGTDAAPDVETDVVQSNDAVADVVDAAFTPATLDQAGKLALWL